MFGAIVEGDRGIERKLVGRRCDRSGASGRGDDAIAYFEIAHGWFVKEPPLF
jgi:hypothetical protein